MLNDTTKLRLLRQHNIEVIGARDYELMEKILITMTYKIYKND